MREKKKAGKQGRGGGIPDGDNNQNSTSTEGRRERRSGREEGWPVESVAMARAHSRGRRSPAGLSEHFHGRQSPHRPTPPRGRGSGTSMVARILFL